MRNISSDSGKFTQLSVVENKKLSFIVNVKKDITDLLENLKNSKALSETAYKV